VGFDRSSRADELFARHTEQMRRELSSCSIPIVGLSAATAPADARFGGLGKSNDVVINVSILYDSAGSAWACVDTERFAGTPVGPTPLRDLVGRHMRLHGDRLSVVEWSEDDATVVVDGRPMPGRMVRAGDRWWAVRCERDDVVISVAGRDWHPAVIAVDTIADVAAMLDRLRPPAPGMVRELAELPADLPGEPHRLLVDAALRSTVERAEWLADGGPVPALPRYWSSLWRAAVARQVDLAGDTEAQAEHAVHSMVDQLVALHQNAAWFRDDAGLRARAIAETLLYATRLTEDVPSRAAQEAWRAGIRRRWLHEWSAWTGLSHRLPRP
jgi:hypothetical protein